jgi:hypothetical protein
MREYLEGHTALWASVVLQAREDVESLALDSPDYRAAVAFLTAESAYWRHGRAEIAAYLGTTGDTLQRIGTAWVTARRRREGLSDLPPVPPRPQPDETTPPKPVLFVPEMLEACLAAGRGRGRRRPPASNPFHPSRLRA